MTNTTDKHPTETIINPTDKQVKEIMAQFGAQVRKARKARNLTNRAAAAQLGLSGGNLSDIEAGKRTLMISSILDLCLKLGIQSKITFSYNK